MPDYNYNVKTKKGHNGVGRVTDAQRNATIERAYSMYEKMGLSDEQIASLIAAFNVESGFNPKAEHTLPEKHKVNAEPSTLHIGATGIETSINASATYNTATHYVGLGQFDEGTWTDAVNLYEKKYGEKLDPAKARYDELSQIKVSGAWMKDKIWPTAVKYDANPSLEGSSLQEIAYGLWHQGANSKADRVKTFLEGTGKDKFLNETNQLSVWFNDTYDNMNSDLLQMEKANKNNGEANKNIGDIWIEGVKKFFNDPVIQGFMTQMLVSQMSATQSSANQETLI